MTPSTLDQLLTTMNRHNGNADNVLGVLPRLITENGMINVLIMGIDGIETTYTLPSIPKMQADLSAGGFTDVITRLNKGDDLIRDLLSKVSKLNQNTGLSSNSPYWSMIDTSSANTDAQNNDPLYRANVNIAIRFPYDAYNVLPPERKNNTDASRVGNYLLPAHTEVLDRRWTGVASATLNVSSYPAFTKTVTYTSWNYWNYYYGYYYYWLGYYYGYQNYNYTYQLAGAPLTGSMTAQTFKTPDARVLKGIDLTVLTSGNNITSAPSLLLVDTAYGMPLLSSVIARGTVVNNAAYNNISAGTYSEVSFLFDNPVLLDPAKQYAFIVMTNGGNYSVAYNTNQQNDGGTFYTQDGAFWSSDLAKDLNYSLRYADFGTGITQSIVELTPLSLSGGIASIIVKLAAQLNAICAIDFQISINDQWQSIGVMQNLSSLPAFSPLRVVFSGTQKVMPLLDVANSGITIFRPSTSLMYISKNRLTQAAGNTFKTTFEIFGFKSQYHTFTPTIKIGATEISPISITSRVSTDSNVTTFTATFQIPATATTGFSHILRGSTLTSTQLFDITSVIEQKG